MQRVRVRSVRLVHEHEDRLVLIQDRELVRDGCRGRRIPRGVLLNHREHHARPLFGEKGLHLLDALANPHALARQSQGVGQLLLQVLAVRDGHHLESTQLGA